MSIPKSARPAEKQFTGKIHLCGRRKNTAAQNNDVGFAIWIKIRVTIGGTAYRNHKEARMRERLNSILIVFISIQPAKLNKDSPDADPDCDDESQLQIAAYSEMYPAAQDQAVEDVCRAPCLFVEDVCKAPCLFSVN
ncbi:MAG: hypothetical protein LBC99_06675 [Spirochaetota bacterium]|jgi:hypothetical protein|nr:hypothetical protein [Spirochaetota bacterium]